jgi:hypothetical protein
MANNSVSDVTFLKKMPELVELDISQNKVSSFNGIVSKNLRKLNASQNELKDIQFLNNNVGVCELNLASNQISDFSILTSLKCLSALSIANNNLQKISTFNNSLCPVTFTEHKFEDLDDDVKQGLTMSGHVNQDNGSYWPYPTVRFRYITLGTDLLSDKCDEAARLADANYRASMILVKAPKPKTPEWCIGCY